MKPSAQTSREAPGSTRRAAHTRLLHTLYVFCATSLMFASIVYTFILLLLLRSISPDGASHRAGLHVTFVDPASSVSSTHTPAQRAAPPPPPRLPENNRPMRPPVPARAAAPSLSLTVTPRELEPPTPDVAEDPLRALSRICAFLVSNTARAALRAELGATPPLAGLEPYLDSVGVDLAYIDELVAEKRAEAEEEDERSADEETIAEGSEDGEDAGPSADSGLGAGEGVGADARAHDGLDLVQPQLAVSAHARPPPPSQFPTPTPTPHPHPPPPPPIITHNLHPPAPTTSIPITDTKPKPKPSADSGTTTTTVAPTTSSSAPPAAGVTPAANPRRRKDAVLRAPSADPSAVDADADDAAVRAAALLARFADIGAELEGTVRERGAALWAALSRRRAPLDLPVPPLPRTRSSAALIAARGAPVVEASRMVAHQAAWRARFAAYGRLFGPIAEQV